MIAYLVVSHVNVPQVCRLVRRLASAPQAAVFVHHDTARHILAPDAFADLANVRIVPSRGPIAWGSFDQVQAMLDGVEAIEGSGLRYEWIVLVSGQDYPCVDLSGFHTELAASRFDGYLDHHDALDHAMRAESDDRYAFRYARVPSRWRRVNASLWRLNRLQPWLRFVETRGGSFVGVADRTPFRRRTCYRGSYWWALSRRAIIRLREVVQREPELITAYRRRLHPDESFVQTILLAERDLRFANDCLQYVRWDDPTSGSPAVLTIADLPDIIRSRRAFARKFDTRVDEVVLDRIDAAVDAGMVGPPEVLRRHVPRLSIGLPVYNGENYVGDAIRSILAQTYENFELIVSDNASTDATPEIVGALARSDRRIRFLRNPRNMGASYNFNRTFALSRGMYFRQAAHDDTLAPTCLERCMEILEGDPLVSLAYTRSLCIDEHDAVLAEYAEVMHFVSDDPVERFAAHLRRAFDRRPEMNRGSNPACNPIFGIARRAELARTPMVASYIASDMILLAELALYGKIYEVPETLFFIRAHPHNSWAQNPSILDVAAWYDPANRGRVLSYMPHLRWFIEYAAAIQRAPLSAPERSACLALLTAWAADHRSRIGRELLGVAARYAGLRPWYGDAGRRIGPPPALPA